jgi:hypothetical protein
MRAPFGISLARGALPIYLTARPNSYAHKKSTGGNMAHPRAADDFAVIRARIEELSRERVPTPAEPEARAFPRRPYHTPSAVTPNADSRRLSPTIRHKLFR